MDQFLAILLCGLFALLLHLYYYTKCSNKTKQAPEVAGAWPILGHLHLFRGSRMTHTTLAAMADKYGPAFMIRLGVRRALVVSTWEVAKECFTTNDKVFLSRPRSVVTKHMGYNFATFSFAPYSAYWLQLRKIVTHQLRSNRLLHLFKHVRITELDISIKELYEVWANKNRRRVSHDEDPVLVEMKRWFRDLTHNIILRIVAGKRCFGSTAACDKEDSRKCRKAIRDYFKLMGMFLVSDVIPYIGWFDFQGYEREMKESSREMDSLLQGWLEEHQRKKLSGGTTKSKEEEEDLMDLMQSVLEDSNLSDQFDTDTINKSTCLAIILGGSDAIMVALTWILSLVMNNRRVLKKAQDELDIHVGRDRHVDESDIKHLVYLQAIVKEGMRVIPPGPLLGPREAIEDCTIAGYHVPAGTRLIVNAWKIHRDPRVWANPFEFQPERFLTTHTEIDVRGQHFQLIPFSAGRRACPGMLLGLQLVHFTLARFLQAFELTTPLDAPVDMTESVGLANLKATPLEVLITPRLPLKHYE